MSLFEHPFGAMRLERYPPGAANDTLQAWDAADKYLLQACPSAQAITGPTLIFNDAFGALACALQGRAPFCVSDSYLSQLATRHNLAQNTQGEQVTMLDSLAPLPPSPGLVLLKVPKTLALLEQQLHAVRQVAGPDTLFLAAGRVREIHRYTLALFSGIIGPTHTSLAQKKARIIYSTLAEQAPLSPPTPCIWPLEHTPYRIHNHANVFSRTSLDIGARFFLSYLPHEVEGTLVDLGCGNGILGLMALTANPRAEIHFVDESYMAIASSRLNISENRPADLPRCRFQVDNGLAGVAADSVQAIVCNPPFHQQQAITDHIARQMFRDARRSLQQGSELRIVANRHLDYFRQLKRLFGNCQALGGNQKFVVLKSVKTRQGRWQAARAIMGLLPRWTIIILRQRPRKGTVMLLQELETRLDAAFSLLENSVIQRQHVWRQEYQSLQHQLEQCLAREARLREHNAMLVGKLNSLDSSPDRNPLLHKIKIISAHIDALAKEAAAFRQSCQH